jgi:hypothetical protein
VGGGGRGPCLTKSCDLRPGPSLRYSDVEEAEKQRVGKHNLPSDPHEPVSPRRLPPRLLRERRARTLIGPNHERPRRPAAGGR